MILTELNQIENLKNQIDNLEESVMTGLLNEADVIAVIEHAMKQIQKLRHEYVDKLHKWNNNDQKPRYKNRSDGKPIEYYMTHVTVNGRRRQITANTLDQLYDKLFNFYGISISTKLNKSTTLRELYHAFDAYRMHDADENHNITHQTVFYQRNLWNKYFEKYPIANVKVINITQSMIFDEYKRITGPGNVTRKAFGNIKCLIDSMFDIALTEKLIENNPSRVIPKKMLKYKIAPDNSDKVYTKEERDKLMEYLYTVNPTVYSLAVQLALCFPCRIGELRAFTWNDYDISNKTIHIWHMMSNTRNNKRKRIDIDVPRTKSNRADGERYLYVNDEAADIIEKLRMINGKKKYILQAGCGSKKPITTTKFNEHLKLYCKNAGVRYLSSHKIRFYGATALFDAGVEPEQIRRIMGHTTLEMTERYNRTKGEVHVDKDIWNSVFSTKKK